MDDYGLACSIYKPLNLEQIEQIHTAALEIIADVGMAFEPGIESVTVRIASKNGVKIENTYFKKAFYDKRVGG